MSDEIRDKVRKNRSHQKYLERHGLYSPLESEKTEAPRRTGEEIEEDRRRLNEMIKDLVKRQATDEPSASNEDTSENMSEGLQFRP